MVSLLRAQVQSLVGGTKIPQAAWHGKKKKLQQAIGKTFETNEKKKRKLKKKNQMTILELKNYNNQTLKYK